MTISVRKISYPLAYISRNILPTKHLLVLLKFWCWLEVFSLESFLLKYCWRCNAHEYSIKKDNGSTRSVHVLPELLWYTGQRGNRVVRHSRSVWAGSSHAVLQSVQSYYGFLRVSDKTWQHWTSLALVAPFQLIHTWTFTGCFGWGLYRSFCPFSWQQNHRFALAFHHSK